MGWQRAIVGSVIGLAVVASAMAQTSGMLRWRTGAAPLGLQAAQADPRVPCGTFSVGCADATTLSLYASAKAPRTLAVQVGSAGDGIGLRGAGTPGLNVALVGKAGIGWDLGVYGRVGTTFNRAAPLLAQSAANEGGLTYGVGLSWDFARSASAAVGLDSYDVRGLGGDVREVRTSLGLQWRY